MSRLRELVQRFADLMRYVGWTSADEQRRRRLAELLLPSADEFVDDFYSQILQHPAASRVLTGGEAQIGRLKRSLHRWMQEMLTRSMDAEYLHDRWQIGHRHVSIGLDQVFVSAALARLRWHMTARIAAQAPADQVLDLVSSLHRLLDLEGMLLQSAFESEYQARQVPVNAARLQQQRWLTRLTEQALQGLSATDLVETACLAVQQALRPAWVMVASQHPDPGMWQVHSQRGWESSPDVVPRLEQDLCETTWSTGTLTFEADVRALPLTAVPALWRSTGLISLVIVRISGHDGPWGWLAAGYSMHVSLTDNDGDFLQSLANVLTTALHQAWSQARRQSNEQRLRRLIDGLPTGAVYVVGDELFMNSAVERLSGYAKEELSTREQWESILEPLSETADFASPAQSSPAGSSPAGSGPRSANFAVTDPTTDLLAEPFIAPLAASQEGSDRVVTRRRQTLRCRNGARLQIETVAFRSASDEIWLVTDISAEEHRRQQSLQAERLATIGQMTAALAHEARNALQRLRASTETLELELDNRPDLAPTLIRLGKAQDDLTTLFDEVRNYSAPIVLQLASTSWLELIQAAWDSLHEQRRGRNAILRTNIPAELQAIQADGFRMEQVFRNLFENALAACASVSGGADPTLTVTVTEGEFDGQPAVRCSVLDNGPGITDDVRKRLFEPFFTTKAKGTGLGMAIAERIVVAHGGQIDVGCPAAGAEFHLLLPRVSHASPTSHRARR
jgi:signal transduction histidine kinase/PAS domain-containing protein